MLQWFEKRVDPYPTKDLNKPLPTTFFAFVWQATKGIQAQTRIVGNGGQPRFFGGKTGFGQGIFDKSAVRLWRFASKQIALGNQLHPQGGQDRLQFCELATVIGR